MLKQARQRSSQPGALSNVPSEKFCERHFITSDNLIRVAKEPAAGTTPIDYPQRARRVATADGDGLVLHDAHTGSTHRLNGAAQYVWELCDGSRSRAALARALAARFEVPLAAASRDVDAALAQFRDVGLVLTPGASAREQEVLTSAVGVALGTTGGSPQVDLAEVDWNAVVDLSVDHGVMPLLHRCVMDHWREMAPSVVRDRLDRQYAANAAVVGAFRAELLELVNELAAVGVAVLPLKGPIIASWVYGSAALRQFGDLDIFVAPGSVARAQDTLRKRGYEFRSERRTDTLAVKASGAGDIHVDLQWALARRAFRFPLRLEELWDRAITIEVDGVAIHQPEPGDYLLILCAHGAKHCWSSLIWIADIAAFLRMFGKELDWAKLVDRAAGVGGEKQLMLGLRLAHELMHADLPQSVAARLRAYPSLDLLVADVRRALFAPARKRTFQRSFGLMRGGIFYMRTRERIRDRLPQAAYLLGQSLINLVELTQPNHLDRAVVELPSWLTFLYYPIRLVRVTVKWAGRLIARSSGR